MKILLNELLEVNENVNLNEYIKYREKVKENMEHPEWLGDFTIDQLNTMLNNNSKIWMYFNNNDFVCSMMMIPATKKDLEKFGLNIDFSKVVDYGPLFVNCEYIGNGLQYQMLCELDSYCISLGYKYAIGTIHPDNFYSINNLLKDGFQLVGQKEFKRGIRNIYLKKY